MTWQEIIITVIGTIVTAMVSWLVAWLTQLVNTKIKNEKGRMLLASALEIVGRSVKVTYQTLVSNVKGTAEWTEETKKKALQQTMDSARAQLSEEVKAYIEQNGTTIEEWLRQQIEAKIYDLKASFGKSSEADEVC